MTVAGPPEAEASPDEAEGPPADEPSALRQSLGRATVYAAAASALTLLAALIKSKVTAVVLGPSGLGRAAEVMQLVTLCVIPMGLVTGPAFIRAIAKAGNDREKLQRAYDGTATLIAGVGLILLAVIGISAWFVFGSGVDHARSWAVLGAVWAIGGAMLALPAQVLMASGRTREFALFSGSIAIAGAAVVSVGTIAAKLDGQFIAMAVVPLALIALCFPLYRRVLPSVRLRPRALIERGFVRETVVLGVTSLVGGFALQGALSAIRWSLAIHGGDEANGQFQAAWAIGSAYLGLVLSGLGSVYFPRYAAASSSEELTCEVNHAVDFVVRSGGPLILLAIALRKPAMHLLYSGKFAVSADMVGYQMAGDLAKAISWAYAGPLLYRGKVRLYLITEGVGAGLLAILSLALIPKTGMFGPSYAYPVVYVVYAFVTAVVISKGCDVRIRWRTTVGATLFAALCAAAVFLSAAHPWLRFVLIGLAILWAHQTGQLQRTIEGVRRKAASLATAWSAR